MKKTILLFASLAFLTTQNQAQTVTDIDGNVYNTVTIGSQIWMKENLKVTHYNNGNEIPNITSNSTWTGMSTGARCYYNNDSITNANIYGALYNYYSISNSDLCPTNWHVPTDSNWMTLFNFLGGISMAANKLMEAGTTHWLGSGSGNNQSGFTALPGGLRQPTAGPFYYINQRGLWWSSTIDNPETTWGVEIWDGGNILHSNYEWTTGLSVRCLCDSAFSHINKINFNNNFQFYPNPAMDKMIIDLTDKQNVDLSIYNAVGQLVLIRQLNNIKNEIDISTLAKGIYIIKVTGVDWTTQKKIIKE
jgi:uncharacterized protein (TIGR02145 family)